MVLHHLYSSFTMNTNPALKNDLTKLQKLLKTKSQFVLLNSKQDENHMRPETATQIIDKTIARYLNDEPTAIYIPDMLRAVRKMYCKQVIWHKENGFGYETWLIGTQTEEQIRKEMEHISDRWNNLQRLAWLLDGIEEKKF